MKVRGRAADQADSCRQAGKDHHCRQKQSAFVAKEDFGAFSKNWCAGFLHADRGNALSSNLGNEDVDQGQKNARNCSRLQDFRGDFRRLVDAVVIDRSNHKRSKNQRSNGVKRVVAVKNALNDGFARGCISFSGRRHVSHRDHVGLNNEDNQRQNKSRGEHLADAIHKLGRRDRKPQRQGKENNQKDGQANVNVFRSQEGSDGNFKRYGACSGGGKARANGQITDHGIENAPIRVNARGNRKQTARA